MTKTSKPRQLADHTEVNWPVPTVWNLPRKFCFWFADRWQAINEMPVLMQGSETTFVLDTGHEFKYDANGNLKDTGMAVVKLNRQTESNRKNAEAVAKMARTGLRATVLIDAITYTHDPYAILQVGNGLTGEEYQGVRLELSPEDLEAVQDAVYRARVALHKVANPIKNPSLTDSAETPW